MPVMMPPYALRLLAGQRKGALDGSRITSIVAPGGVCASSRFRVPLPSRVARTCRDPCNQGPSSSAAYVGPSALSMSMSTNSSG